MIDHLKKASYQGEKVFIWGSGHNGVELLRVLSLSGE